MRFHFPLLLLFLQRLKAALSQQSPSGLGMGGMMGMGCSPMVPQRAEQSQLLVQHPDAPSPAQPQVHSRHPTTERHSSLVCVCVSGETDQCVHGSVQITVLGLGFGYGSD
jgi:hypothetical protein